MMITKQLVLLEKRKHLLHELIEMYQTNIDEFRPRNQTKDLLLSKTKNCKTLIKQTETTRNTRSKSYATEGNFLIYTTRLI